MPPVLLSLLLTTSRFVRAIREGLREHEFRGLFFAVLATLLSGTFVYVRLEGWRPLDAFYFTVITLTTVGYGDFSPKTDLGKIFTVVYIFIGLGLLLSFIDAVARYQRKRPGVIRKAAERRSEGADQRTARKTTGDSQNR